MEENSNNVLNDKKENGINYGSNAMTLSWSFGFNKDMINGVYSLNGENTKHALFYSAAHTGIIYDYANRRQDLLQGHCNRISCSRASEDKRWIITGDNGKEESMVVVWSTKTGNPIYTIFDPHPGSSGVIALDITPDSLLLVTLSALIDVENVETKGTFPQEIAIWEWTIDTNDKEKSCLYRSNIEINDFQHCVKFNPFDIREIITNGNERVIFWTWFPNQSNLQFYSPSISQKNFKQTIGIFTQSLFIPNSTKAITATEDGDIVIWDINEYDKHLNKEIKTSLEENVNKHSIIKDRKPIKIIKIFDKHIEKNLNHNIEKNNKIKHSKNNCINVVTETNGFIVIGGENGTIRFYDYQFRLIAWFEDLNAGPITSISFSYRPQNIKEINEVSNDQNSLNKIESNSNPSLDDIPSCIIGTKSAFIIGIQPSSIFEEINIEKKRGTLLVQGLNESIKGISCHPFKNEIVIACISGIIQLWDIQLKKLLMVRDLNNNLSDITLNKDKNKNNTKFIPSIISFGPTGQYIVIGSMDGKIKLVDSSSFKDITTFHESKHLIIEIKISNDSLYIAAADEQSYVYLWQYKKIENILFPNENKEKNNIINDTNDDWIYIGRIHSHSKAITGLEFSKKYNSLSDNLNNNNNINEFNHFTSLISIGEDRKMIEYDLKKSSIKNGIVIIGQPVQIEQEAIPTTCYWYPTIPLTFRMNSNQTVLNHEDLILIANDEYKLKLWNIQNKTCRKTILGPTYGGPINKIETIPTWMYKDQISNYKNNTNLNMDMYCAYSTKEKLVGLIKLPLDGNPHKTMGLIAHPGEISNVLVSFNGKYLITAGGSDMTVNIWNINVKNLDLQEAKNSLRPYYYDLITEDFYNEIIDFFYYSQIRSQGENITENRDIKSIVPLNEIPNLMRALGYYPTQEEIKNIISEVKYSQFIEKINIKEYINLDEFIKLYINHRPVFNIGKKKMKKAFEILTKNIDLNQLNTNNIELNNNNNHSILFNDLKNKLYDKGEKMSEQELTSCLDALMIPSDIKISDPINAEIFANKILGFEDYDTTH